MQTEQKSSVGGVFFLCFVLFLFFIGGELFFFYFWCFFFWGGRGSGLFVKAIYLSRKRMKANSHFF